MTLVIVTTGIDLSVGGLIAFSGVVTALCIQALGGESPGNSDLWMGASAAVLLCGLIGMGTGSMITFFKIPAFIVTLGVMFIAKGLAFILSNSEPITVENDAFAWLGRGADFAGIPNSVSHDRPFHPCPHSYGANLDWTICLCSRREFRSCPTFWSTRPMGPCFCLQFVWLVSRFGRSNGGITSPYW